MLSHRRIVSWILLSLLSLSTTGCGKQTGLLGRWYSKDVSVRFRSDGTVLYNSRSTGLVEGQYRYEPSLTHLASAKAHKNLTIWLPQPGKTLVLDFEVRQLGNDRIQLKRIDEAGASRNISNSLMSTVLKRADDQSSNSDGLDSKPPIVSATRENES